MRERGLLIREVFKFFGNGWAECFSVVEFVLYNTPRLDLGFTPRDIDRRWSTASPLERELLPLEPAPAEPLSDVARRDFQHYRQVRELLLQHTGRQGRRNAELANRFRRARSAHVGAKVFLRDPKLQSAGVGRTPRRRLLQPAEVIKVEGHRVDLRKPYGVVFKGVHLENFVEIPTDVDDWEIPGPRPAQLEPDLPVTPSEDPPRPLGQMLEAGGADRLEMLGMANQKTRLRGLESGRYIVHTGDGVRRCRISRVLSVHPPELLVQAHRYSAVTDARLRVRWVPQFTNTEGEVVLGAGSNPVKQSIGFAAAIIGVVELHDGVLAHSSARKLNRAGWRVDAASVAADGAVVLTTFPGVELLKEPTAREALRLEFLRVAVQGEPKARVSFSGDAPQQWVQEYFVDFVGLFDGDRGFSLAVKREGLRVGQGLDKVRSTYGQAWELGRPETRGRLRWLICSVLRPRGLHAGTPCTPWCVIGRRQPDDLAHTLRPRDRLLDASGDERIARVARDADGQPDQ